jgi:hypothetical protein
MTAGLSVASSDGEQMFEAEIKVKFGDVDGCK